MFWNRNHWKDGLKDKWTFERSQDWNGWIWVRRTRGGVMVGKSYKTFARKAWCENHASVFGLNGKRKPFDWQIVSIGGEWQWTVFRDNKVFQKSHRKWSTKKQCLANATRHGWKK